jgi:diphthamide synthase (EF-2-diphthine--ammonia ligase)
LIGFRGYATLRAEVKRMKPKIVLAWSGGKDSTMTLYTLRRSRRYPIAALLTTVNEHYQRISMHGVRQMLLEQQASLLGLPLHPVYLSQTSSNDEYEARMEAALRIFQAQGVEAMAFGDIFLEDLRATASATWLASACRGCFPSGNTTRANWCRPSFDSASRQS